MISEFNAQDSPYPPGSPDDIAYRRAMWRGPAVATAQLVPGAVAQLLPAAQNEQGDVRAAWPGLATALYGGLGQLTTNALNYVRNNFNPAVSEGIDFQQQPQTQYAPRKEPLVHNLPGVEAAQQSYEDTKRLARNLIIPTALEPQNIEEQRAAEIGFSAGAMSLPLTGVLKAGITSLPQAVQGVATKAAPWVVPTYHSSELSPALSSLSIGGTMGAFEGYQAEQQQRLLEAQELIRRDTQAAQQPDVGHTVVPPGSGASVVVPFPISSTQTKPTETPKPSLIPGLISQAEAAPVKTPTTTPTTSAPPTPPQAPPVDTQKPVVSSYGSEGPASNVTFGKGILGTLALGAGGLIALRYGHHVATPATRFMTRTMEQLPTKAKIADANTRIAAEQAGNIKFGEKPVEAPLPGKAGSPGTAITQEYIDKTALKSRIAEQVHSTPIAENRKAAYRNMEGAADYNAFVEQMNTGVSKFNGGKQNTPVVPMFREEATLSPAQKEKLQNGLFAADELDSRTMQFNAQRAKGGPFNEEATRHNFRTTHTDDVRQMYNDMMNDPQTASIARQHFAVGRELITEAKDFGWLSASDEAKLLKQRPHHMPSVDAEGKLSSGILQERNLDVKGWDRPPTDWKNPVMEHYLKFYEELQRNRQNLRDMKDYVAYHAADPVNRSRIVSEISKPGQPVSASANRALTVFDNGVPRTFEIHNSALHRAFVNNRAQVNLASNIAETMKHMWQSGTTGAMAGVAGGRWFAPISLVRNTIQRIADPSVSTLQKYNPAQWVGPTWEAGKGVSVVLGKTLADVIRNPGNPTIKRLYDAGHGPQLKALGDRIEQKLANTNYSQARARGVTGLGMGMEYKPTSYLTSQSRASSRNPLAARSPGVFSSEDVLMRDNWQKLPGIKHALPTYINFRTLTRDILGAISDGVNIYHYKDMAKRNPAMSEARLVAEARSITGDPSLAGSSRIAQATAKSIPFLTAGAQDAMRLGRNFRDHPVATAHGIAMTAGLMAIAEHLSAMMGGQEHMDMLSQKLNSQNAAANMTLFHNPKDAHDYTQISSPQLIRWIYPYFREAVATATNSFNMRQGEPAWDRTIHTLADFFSHHISRSTIRSSLEGAGDYLDILQVPPPVKFALAAFGLDVSPSLKQLAINKYEGRPLGENMVSRKDGGAYAAPGYTDGHAVFAPDESTRIKNMLGALFGVAASGIHAAWTGAKNFNVDHSLGDAVSAFGSEYLQNLKDHTPGFNFLWHNQVKQSRSNPTEDYNWRTFQALKEVPGVAADRAAEAGLTRVKGLPIASEGERAMSRDPQMLEMRHITRNYAKLLSRDEQEIRDLKKQLSAVEGDRYLSAPDVRLRANDIADKLHTVHLRANEKIQKLNAALSHIAGRPVELSAGFDWSKDVSQFR